MITKIRNVIMFRRKNAYDGLSSSFLKKIKLKVVIFLYPKTYNYKNRYTNICSLYIANRILLSYNLRRYRDGYVFVVQSLCVCKYIY